MRLLNARTYRLEQFTENDVPQYAILSHTWGSEEVTFQEMQEDVTALDSKPSYRKIIQTCQQGLRDNLSYVWVDTCCIDKTSSAELSEAINSMFRWYKKSKVCYAYLSDVPSGGAEAAIRAGSRWFKRGWTLQELLAPSKLVFYASDWQPIGTRSNLAVLVSYVTRIDVRFLTDGAAIDQILQTASVAQRMSWAAMRETARTEDIAYCLLGLFDINMPLLYGEGGKAFIRLQEEIIRRSNDQSIFAWSTAPFRWQASTPDFGVLASSPDYFAESADIIPIDGPDDSVPSSLTNRGLNINLRILVQKSHTWRRELEYVALLRCQRLKAYTHLIGVPLRRRIDGRWTRNPDQIRMLDIQTWHQTQSSLVYLAMTPDPAKSDQPRGISVVDDEELFRIEVSLGYTWSPKTNLITRSQTNIGEFGDEEITRIFLTPIPVSSQRAYDLIIVTVARRHLSLHPIIGGDEPGLLFHNIEFYKAGRPLYARRGDFRYPSISLTSLNIFERTIVRLSISSHNYETMIGRNWFWIRLRSKFMFFKLLFWMFDFIGARRIIILLEPILVCCYLRLALGVALWSLIQSPESVMEMWRGSHQWLLSTCDRDTPGFRRIHHTLVTLGMFLLFVLFDLSRSQAYGRLVFRPLTSIVDLYTPSSKLVLLGILLVVDFSTYCSSGTLVKGFFLVSFVFGRGISELITLGMDYEWNISRLGAQSISSFIRQVLSS